MIIAWLIISAIVASFISANRKIGWFGAFLLCVILSPLLGAIIGLLLDKK